jgi:hypothetical protein
MSLTPLPDLLAGAGEEGALGTIDTMLLLEPEPTLLASEPLLAYRSGNLALRLLSIMLGIASGASSGKSGLKCRPRDSRRCRAQLTISSATVARFMSSTMGVLTPYCLAAAFTSR